MKKLLSLLMMFAASSAFAQSPADSTLQNWTSEELAKKTKIELTSIYMGEITEMLNFAPSTALSLGDVPDNKYIAKQWKKINNSTIKNAVKLKQGYKDIIPYADKQQIIEAVLYLQGVNNYLHML
jgi:hypothetical protein